MPVPSSLFPLRAFGGLGLLATRGRWRKRAILALVGLLLTFAFETAVHSVHHLGATDALGACVVLSASNHVAGVCDATIIVGPTWIAYAAPVSGTNEPHSLLWFRLDEARAPPAAPSS